MILWIGVTFGNCMVSKLLILSVEQVQVVPIDPFVGTIFQADEDLRQSNDQFTLQNRPGGWFANIATDRHRQRSSSNDTHAHSA